eukprot:1960107-Alexandrium_andersonii.AAC.1
MPKRQADDKASAADQAGAKPLGPGTRPMRATSLLMATGPCRAGTRTTSSTARHADNRQTDHIAAAQRRCDGIRGVARVPPAMRAVHDS